MKPLHHDPGLKRKLKEASKKVPKYLFRMWHSGSGGDSRLNTTSEVTPLAFLHGNGHDSVYDMTEAELVRNATMHVQWSKRVHTEFSSWSQSPNYVFDYAMAAHSQKESEIHIAIIDTEGLAKTNPAFHVPALRDILPDFDAPWEEEYLVHGIVKGEFYKAVPFTQLCDRGLLNHLPRLLRAKNPVKENGSSRELPKDLKPFKIEELDNLVDIARLFGERFCIPFAIVLFCCRKQPELWSKLTLSDLKKIVKILGDRQEIPIDWAASPSVFCEGLFPKGYEANQQMVNVMRSLHEYAWGKGARHRSRSATTDANTKVIPRSQKPTSDEAVRPSSGSDGEDIAYRMSSLTVSPSKESTRVPTSQGEQTSRTASKRARPLSGSELWRLSISGIEQEILSLPAARISSPYVAPNRNDLHGLQIQLHPQEIQAALDKQKLIFAQGPGFHFMTSDSEMQWRTTTKVLGQTSFKCITQNNVSLWFALLESNFHLKINGEDFNKTNLIVIGPLPPFSIWECEDQAAFVYAERAGVDYRAAPDYTGSVTASKRQKH